MIVATCLPGCAAAARAIVARVLAEPIPDVENAGPSMGGWYWRLQGHGWMHTAPDAETARAFLIDGHRRTRVAELAAGQPKEVAELAWELLPYLSLTHRFGSDVE